MNVSPTLVALAALALPLAACSGEQQTTATSATVQAHHNQADSHFVTAMAKHHQQALDMAALVPDRSQNADVRAIAAKIHDEQAPEITKFDQLAKDFSAQATMSTSPPQAGGAPMPEMSPDDMDGMVSDKAVEHLRTLSGPDFDKAWVGLMIEHHNGAVEMAQDELRSGDNAEAKQLAHNIVTTQTAEIDELGKLAAKLQSTN